MMIRCDMLVAKVTNAMVSTTANQYTRSCSRIPDA